MNGGAIRRRGPDTDSRQRIIAVAGDLTRVDDVDEFSIGNLMQGADPADGSVYPGDRAFVSRDAITLQVHALDVEVPSAASVQATALAIHLPEGFSSRVLLQD